MIRYALTCEHEHGFESWFQSSDAFDEQVAHGLVLCPQCQSHHVSKAIMAPAIATFDQRPPGEVERSGTHIGLARESFGDEKSATIRRMMRQLRDEICEGAQDVGADFAIEARKIHEGAAPVRPIIGQATAQDAKELLDDGIDVLPLPIFPDERN